MTYFQKRKKPTVREIRAFRGVHFTQGESSLSLDTASASANVYVDAQGHIKKRTGYRTLFQGEEKINGLFLFEYTDRAGTKHAQHLLHMGTDLYLCTPEANGFTLGTCISRALENRKSRSFMFGGALYLLGAGYFKIMYDATFDMLACGRVCQTETDTAVYVLAEECEANEAPLSDNRAAYLCASAQEKAVVFREGIYNFTNGTKLYVAPPEAAQAVHVVRVEYALADGTQVTLSPLHYQIACDNTGLYVELKRNDIYFDEWMRIRPTVVFTYNGFVYTPTSILSRTPTPIASLDVPTPDETPYYDGTFLESYNLAAPQRCAEFLVPAGARGNNAYRFYLEAGGKGKVLRIYIDGELVQKYSKFLNGHSEPTVGSYECVFAELEAKLLPETACTVRIEYIRTTAADDSKTGAPDGCTVFGLFGGKNDTRVFLGGNPKYIGYDFAGGLYDATYFPDTGYTLVGSDASAIVGYHKISGYQVILKDGKNHDASQYLRTFGTDADGNVVFTIQQGAQGVGAASASSFKTVRDHMLFAAEDGIYELRSTQVQTQLNLHCLSEAVREKLTGFDAANACAAVWNDLYCISSGTGLFLYDAARQGAWYYYDGLPELTCIYIEDGTFFFGASDGGVYRFMDETEPEAYYDRVGTDGSTANAVAIDAYWDVPTTALGNGYCRKSIEDFCVYLLPETAASIRIGYSTEVRWPEDTCHAEAAGKFDFNAMCFSNFSFDTSDFPICINTRAKAKRVRVFGARIGNAVPGESMCVTGLAIRYRENNAIR